MPVPNEVVHRVLPELTAAVEARNGYITATLELGFEFGSRLYQPFSMSPLGPVSWGDIELRKLDGEHEITYRLSLFRVRVGCLLFTVAAPVFVYLLGKLGGDAPPPWALLPIYIALIWGWGYGMGRLVTAIRFRSFVGRVIQTALDAECATAQRAEP